MPRQLRLSSVQKFLVAAVILTSIFFVFFWRLGSLTVGLSPAEAAARTSSKSFDIILKNPINAPHKLLQYSAQSLGYSGAAAMRLASVIFAAIMLLCLYRIVRVWFGAFIGAVGIFLAIGMPWFIILSRSATPDIMLLTPLMPAAAYMWMSGARRYFKFAFLVFCITIAINFYIPGAIWLMALGLIFGFRFLRQVVTQAGSAIASVGGLLIILLMVPLVWASFNNWHVLRDLLLIPSPWPGLLALLKGTGWAVLSLPWRTREHIDFIIARFPLLNVTQMVLIIFGTYAMLTQARRELLLLGGVLAASIVLAGINNNPVLLTLGLPVLFILVTAGLKYLYAEWHTIFPRNPLPHALAIILICLLSGLYLMFGIRYSLIAWPHTPENRQLYMLK